jgi:hypothetical protein
MSLWRKRKIQEEAMGKLKEALVFRGEAVALEPMNDEWINLTETEIQCIIKDCPHPYKVARAVEEALKEKNAPYL